MKSFYVSRVPGFQRPTVLALMYVSGKKDNDLLWGVSLDVIILTVGITGNYVPAVNAEGAAGIMP
jgi:hypothetical protein